MDLHCAATGSNLQRLGLGSLSHLADLDRATRVTYAAQGPSVKHLSVLPRSPPTPQQPSLQPFAKGGAADRALVRLQAQPARQSVCAKQVLASMVIFYATFIPVP